MERDSINIYLPPDEVAQFRVWARLEGVKKTSPPDELNMVNSADPQAILFVGTKLLADHPILFEVIKKVWATGRRLIGVGRNEKDLEIKTESEIKTALSLGLDLYGFKLNYDKTTSVKKTSTPKKVAVQRKKSTRGRR